MKRQLGISALLLMVAVAALVLALLRDLPLRRLRDDHARKEAAAMGYAERYRLRRDLCLDQPPGEIHDSHDQAPERCSDFEKRIGLAITRTCLEEAISCESIRQFHLKNAEFERFRKLDTQRQMIFPW